jgi:hypothetical protein
MFLGRMDWSVFCYYAEKEIAHPEDGGAVPKNVAYNKDRWQYRGPKYAQNLKN